MVGACVLLFFSLSLSPVVTKRRKAEPLLKVQQQRERPAKLKHHSRYFLQNTRFCALILASYFHLVKTFHKDEVEDKVMRGCNLRSTCVTAAADRLHPQLRVSCHPSTCPTFFLCVKSSRCWWGSVWSTHLPAPPLGQRLLFFCICVIF